MSDEPSQVWKKYIEDSLDMNAAIEDATTMAERILPLLDEAIADLEQVQQTDNRLFTLFNDRQNYVAKALADHLLHQHRWKGYTVHEQLAATIYWAWYVLMKTDPHWNNDDDAITA